MKICGAECGVEMLSGWLATGWEAASNDSRHYFKQSVMLHAKSGAIRVIFPVVGTLGTRKRGSSSLQLAGIDVIPPRKFTHSGIPHFPVVGSRKRGSSSLRLAGMSPGL